MSDANKLPALLKQYWGYESFLPFQERIVRSLVAGHDTCVVMPTGGGKSLCYQLPAVLMGGTVIVISPLIALMQDQVAQLHGMGISAGALNSMISRAERKRMQRQAAEGAFRLLYLSPERLAFSETVSWLKQVPIKLFAIDEAHCISEWGHEFRPEYRQLSSLRGNFPHVPIAAFTASATRQVRHDILEQLKLRNPDRYIASFRRKNLRYIVHRTDSVEQRPALVRALNHYREGNVIVYAPTIAEVEENVGFLVDQGIRAVAYHGQMEKQKRQRNQEKWTSEEVRVLVGTVAFGLGINKASVRAVIHLSLPKSLEQYYQEAGRAGRDGLFSDCVLLWKKKDAGLLAYFIGEIKDDAERERAWKRYHQIKNFVESKACRHRQICLHFGETPKWSRCDACDVCGCEPPWLSCGASPRADRKRTVQLLKREGHFASRSDFETPKDMPNEELRRQLREWRRKTATEENVRAFMIMHDSTLDSVCRQLPTTMGALRNIHGIGRRKAEYYGQQLIEIVRAFRPGRPTTPICLHGVPAAGEILRYLSEGRTIDEIAQLTGRARSTIVYTIACLISADAVDFDDRWVEDSRRSDIEAACAEHGIQSFRQLRDVLPADTPFDDIRLVVAHLRRKQGAAAIT